MKMCAKYTPSADTSNTNCYGGDGMAGDGGWLGYFIGNAAWEPIWNSSSVAVAAKSLSKELGDYGKNITSKNCTLQQI